MKQASNLYEQLCQILLELCGPQALEPGCDLLESGLLDSLALIELSDRLEELGLSFPVARIDKQQLRTADSLIRLIEAYNP